MTLAILHETEELPVRRQSQGRSIRQLGRCRDPVGVDDRTAFGLDRDTVRRAGHELRRCLERAIFTSAKGPGIKMNQSGTDRRQLARACWPIQHVLHPHFHRNVARRLTGVIGERAGYTRRPAQLQREAIAAGTSGERQRVRGDAGSDCPHREWIDRNREAHERGGSVGGRDDRQSFQPVVGYVKKGAAEGSETHAREGTAFGIEHGQSAFERLVEG